MQQQRLGLELLVFGDQLVTAAELLADALPQAQRPLGQPVEGSEHLCHVAAQRLEHIEAGIHHHQRDRQHDQHQQADTQRGTLGKKRFDGSPRHQVLPTDHSVESRSME
ncbi:hypothetical protein D3C80_1863830 [compost metagenome]